MRIKDNSKKAMVFTIIAITLLSIMAVSMTIVSISHERSSTTKRIGTLNDFVYSFEKDLPRKLYISGFRMIFLYEKRMYEMGDYLTDVNGLVNETFFEGTIDGVASEDETQLLAGVLYSDIEEDLKTAAAKVNLNFVMTNPEINLNQTDPWNLNFTLTFNLFIEDIGGLASWNKTAVVNALVSIENFEDPLYIIGTNGLFSPKINQTIYNGFVSGSNVTNLTNHLENKYYISTNESPSFINRLEGNFNSSEFGIESLVYLPDLTDAGLTALDKSVVDHIYFSSSNPTKRQVTGMPSWFKIDSAHESTYNVSSLVI